MELSKEVKGYLMQEAYYGKLPEFNEMEKLFDSIIVRVKKEKEKSNPNKYPEMKKISKLFCKIFGFKKAIIHWEPFNEENAYTISLNTFLIFANKNKEMIKKKKNGFYDTSHSIVLTVYLSVGDILSANLTSREMIAVVLHEIGHNFDLSGYHLISYYLNCITSLGLYAKAAKKYKNIDQINKTKEKYYNDKELENSKYYNNTKKRKEVNEKIKEYIGNALKSSAKLSLLTELTRIISLPVMLLLTPFSQVSLLADKKGELFADSFAVAYGYGTELMTALEKFSDYKKYYNPKSKIQKTLYDLSLYQNESYIAAFDCHGSNQERCYEALKKLKNDLKTGDFSPELKEELENEIKRIQEQLDIIVSMPNEERRGITRLWRKINAVIFRHSPNLISKLFKTNKV